MEPSDLKSSGADEHRRMVILTGGVPASVSPKTADAMLRYRPEEVVALIDAAKSGKAAEEVLGVGGAVPFVSSLEEAPAANTLLVGVAPPGGRIPESWRPIILTAIDRGWQIISGLHQFLSEDPEFAERAAASEAILLDLRKNNEHEVATCTAMRSDCLRVLTVGHDCNVGKMLASYELTKALQQAGTDAKFVATGQTGILLAGEGCPIDCVVSDFLNGAAEKLVLANQHHEVLLIEGQGNITHPRYSPVTLGLLHGCRPQAMILCYEVGRKTVGGMKNVPLNSLAELKRIYEQIASLLQPSEVIGVAMNSRFVGDEQAQIERDRVRNELGVPVCDVIRHGPDELVAAIQQCRASL